MLGVSTVTGRQIAALQLLAKRGSYRRQRHGTFVSESVAIRPDHFSTSIVHLLVHESFVKTEGVLADGVMLPGSRKSSPQAEMNFNFLPTGDADRQTLRLVTSAQRSQTPSISSWCGHRSRCSGCRGERSTDCHLRILVPLRNFASVDRPRSLPGRSIGGIATHPAWISSVDRCNQGSFVAWGLPDAGRHAR